MYQASAYLDHKLKWDLFRLPELECFDTMLNKLFRDELIELVKRLGMILLCACLTSSFIVQVRGGEVQNVPGADQQESFHHAEQESDSAVIRLKLMPVITCNIFILKAVYMYFQHFQTCHSELYPDL